MSKDFFDEEFEKMEKEQKEKADEQRHDDDERRKREIENWYSSRAPQNGSGNGGSSGNGGGSDGSRKRTNPWAFVLLGILLAMCIVFGWVLCEIFSQTSKTISDDDAREELISYVVDYMDKALLYTDISDEDWEEAVAAAGTAMLQSVGDKFCYLFTPQQMYDVVYPTTSSVSPNQTYFGISYSFVKGLGIYISDVQTDSACYGYFQSGDVVLKLTEIDYIENTTVTLDGEQLGKPTELLIADYGSDAFSAYMQAIKSARFVFARDGETQETDVITRGSIPTYKYEFKGKSVEYDFVEFYLKDAVSGEIHSNISTAETALADRNNTYDLRHLDELPDGVGYIRLLSFMYDGEDESHTCASEFKSVMEIFKTCGLTRLVLDLKGNGGGVVEYAAEIAGMLSTSSKLTDDEKEAVTVNGELLITDLIARDNQTYKRYTAKSSYADYFGSEPSANDDCNIVVWTDGNSASASELLTGVLRDYQTGFQIGTTTYGKGIAQTYDYLPYTGTVTGIDGTKQTYYWGIYYTFAQYRSPVKEENIHGKGYTPDDGYDNCKTYAQLWQATENYWGIAE